MPDDVLVPKAGGQNRDAHYVLYWFRHDCALLGLRRRRQYDSRRTFISLAQADGARKDILRWVTHGPEGDIVSLYTTLPWAALCDEVAKLNVGLRAGRLLQLPKMANVEDSDGVLLQPLLQTPRVNSEAFEFPAFLAEKMNVPDGIRTLFRQLG